MPSGSCVCGATTYEITGKPEAIVACHCLPCRKTSGTTNSINLMVSDTNLCMSGGPLDKYTRSGESGKDVTYGSCPKCHTIITVDAAAMDGQTIVKLGTLDGTDDQLAQYKPAAEIYTKHRIAFTHEYDGAAQKEGGA